MNIGPTRHRALLLHCVTGGHHGHQQDAPDGDSWHAPLHTARAQKIPAVALLWASEPRLPNEQAGVAGGSCFKASWHPFDPHMLRRAQRAACGQLVRTPVIRRRSLPLWKDSWLQASKAVAGAQFSIPPPANLRPLRPPPVPIWTATSPSMPASIRLLLLGVALLVAVHVVSGAVGLPACSCGPSRPEARCELLRPIDAHASPLAFPFRLQPGAAAGR